MAQGLITKNKTIRSKLIKIYIRFEAVEYRKYNKHLNKEMFDWLSWILDILFSSLMGYIIFFSLFSISFLYSVYIFEIGILSFSLVYLMRGNMPIMWIDFLLQLQEFRSLKWCCLYMVVIIIVSCWNPIIKHLMCLFDCCYYIVFYMCWHRP